jgi:acrylyl-CoA reductase (NADPH)
MPFILRGVSLVGIDSAECPMATRRKLWQNMATDWKPTCLSRLASEVGFSDLGIKVEEILSGNIAGRVLVKPAS